MRGFVKLRNGDFYESASCKIVIPRIGEKQKVPMINRDFLILKSGVSLTALN